MQLNLESVGISQMPVLQVFKQKLSSQFQHLQSFLNTSFFLRRESFVRFRLEFLSSSSPSPLS